MEKPDNFQLALSLVYQRRDALKKALKRYWERMSKANNESTLQVTLKTASSPKLLKRFKDLGPLTWDRQYLLRLFWQLRN